MLTGLAKGVVKAIVRKLSPRVVHRAKDALFNNYWSRIDFTPAMMLDVNYASRMKIWDQICTAHHITSKIPIDYLEFGVFRGESISWWMEKNKNADSRFYGFDTFEGLPHEWVSLGSPQGTFNVGGNSPDMSDIRVEWVKGLFKDTLPGFLKTHQFNPVSRPLIIHFDSDLFSSTISILANIFTSDLRNMKMIWIVDQFGAEEGRAFEAFHEAYGFEYTPIASNREKNRVGFIIRP
jgi:hypothetical protein